MKVAILAGGLGTRMGGVKLDFPKPLLKLGNHPLLWHVMQLCSAQGHSEFIVALGSRGAEIKDYFARYRVLEDDISVDLRSGTIDFHGQSAPDWRVRLIDTGPDTKTGGRLKRLGPWLRGESHFLLVYADGLADIDLRALEQFHLDHGRLATLTAVRVPERFGRLALQDDTVTGFQEKPDDGQHWINGGFFVLSPKVLDCVKDDATVWEREPLQRLCAEGELRAFRHDGFWSGCDTPVDLSYLESVWRSGQAPWKVEPR